MRPSVPPRDRFPRRKARVAKPKSLIEGHVLIRPFLEKMGYNPANYAVFEAWDNLLGSASSAHAKAAGLRKGQLVVNVSSSARLHDLTLRKAQLLKKLQGYFGGQGAKPPVSDIIFQISDEDR